MPQFEKIKVMQFARPVLLVVAILLSSFVSAAELKVTVLDNDGSPVPDVAVYMEPVNPKTLPPPKNYAVMDQIDTRFVPHVLIVQAGTEVRFPNSDVIAHHVYSFSNPNDFMLPLYKGNAHPPVTFEESGVVILGCNIHDQMLGYILVVETEIFAKTDEKGQAILSVRNDAAGTINIWSPRINQKGELLSHVFEAAQDSELVFRIRGKLRPPHDSSSGALKWSDY